MANGTGKLYVVATPIGHIQDITKRAIEVFRQTSVFFAEDSRELKKLLGLLEVSIQGKRIYSMAQHNMKEAVTKATDCLLAGKSVCLTTDRGTPAISDPGALLVESAHSKGIAVLPIPGPCSVVTLFSVSGLRSAGFIFLGFLPQSNKDRSSVIRAAIQTEWPFIVFESPKRIRKALVELASTYHCERVFIGREMTKAFESYGWYDLSELNVEDFPEKGEYALIVIPGASQAEEKSTQIIERAIDQRLISDKQWSKQMAEEHGVSAKRFYDSLQKAKGQK